MVVKNYKTVTIASRLTDTNIFTVPINLQFIPSYFIVKYASFVNMSSSDSIDTVLLLKTSLYNNETIVSFSRSGTEDVNDVWSGNLDLKYKMNPMTIAGNYDFTFTNVDGNVLDDVDNNVIQIALTIEFIEDII